MEDDEGTTPRRPRRRAVRPAGPGADATVPEVAKQTGQDKPAVQTPPDKTAPQEKSPAADEPVSGTGTKSPASEVSTPEAAKPVVSMPEAAKPDVSAPDLSKPVSTPDAATPAVTPSDVSASDAALSEASSPDASSPDTAVEETPGQGRRRGSVVLTALFVVVVLALLTAGVYLFMGLRSANADDARSEQFVQTARQTVLNLTTIHPDSAQEDVDRLLAGASGDFKAEFEGREAPFVEVVKQAKVDSNGEIIEAGIESEGDDFAEVLVAARAMVQNSDAQEPQPRDFRLRIRIVDDSDVMTASRVEFVP